MTQTTTVPSTEDEQLRRFVVRIDTRQGVGTGVLVAPGWVLTCAHVVEGCDTARVVPDRSAAADGTAAPVPPWVDAEVRARSHAPDAASQTAFWPFPDLALLELPNWTDHVCAPLTKDRPQGGGEPHAWGFGRREQGVASPGSAASFTYVGTDGDGYLQLRAGDAPPGLSGAPLVCPQRRAVAGVMSVSRNPSDARGGWAAPVAALEGGPGVPDELTRLGREVLARNRDVSWRHRNVWQSALPIPGADRLVDRPWDGAEVDPESAQPSAMLRAEFRVVPYRFRDTELSAFLDWCDSRPRLAVSYLEAAGGAGKTRFAIEACLAAQSRGWLAGLLPKQDRGADDVPLPRLLVVDYVEEREATGLAERLAALDRSATVLAPVRVLLLSRPTSAALAGRALEPLKELASGAALTAVETAKDRSSAAAGLAIAERRPLFDDALREFGRTWYDTQWTPADITGPDLSASQYARPLDVLLEAYDAALSGPGWQPGGRPPVDRALDHEIRHWRSRIPDVEPAVLIRAVTLATLAGARDEAEAHTLFDLKLVGELGAASRRRFDHWLQGLYEGPERWNPLRPDRLGEALIARTLRAEQDHGRTLLAAALNLRSDAQLERVLDVLARLTTDQATEDIVAVTLAQQHTALVKRCAEQTRGTPQRPGRTGLLDGLTRLHTKLLTDQRVTNLPLSVQSALSSSADNLGDLARAHGLSARALAIFQDAFIIDKRKHELEPGNTTYRRDLSISYERLADLAREARDLEIARDFVVRAVSIRRAIHRLEQHREDVAVELAYTLYLSAAITVLGEQENAVLVERQQIVDVLDPFERVGLLGARGHSLLVWAREEGSD
ncbi:MAG: trypsin-like peptidase domain-containing protein [Pseudonocardiaceae bacterium]